MSKLKDAMQAIRETPRSAIGDIEELTGRLDEAETAKRQAFLFLRGVIELAPVAIIVCDCEGKFKVWNEKANELVGDKPKDVPPEFWPQAYQLFDPSDHTKLIEKAPLAEALETEREVHKFMWIGNGSRRLVECVARPVYCIQRLIGAVVYFKESETHDRRSF